GPRRRAARNRVVRVLLASGRGAASIEQAGRLVASAGAQYNCAEQQALDSMTVANEEGARACVGWMAAPGGFLAVGRRDSAGGACWRAPRDWLAGSPWPTGSARRPTPSRPTAGRD